MATESYVPTPTWQIKALAEAADKFSKSGAAKHNEAIAQYSEGVRDAFRMLIDDLDPRTEVVMGEIYEIYLESV